jgi:hypothetical protein
MPWYSSVAKSRVWVGQRGPNQTKPSRNATRTTSSRRDTAPDRRTHARRDSPPTAGPCVVPRAHLRDVGGPLASATRCALTCRPTAPPSIGPPPARTSPPLSSYLCPCRAPCCDCVVAMMCAQTALPPRVVPIKLVPHLFSRVCLLRCASLLPPPASSPSTRSRCHPTTQAPPLGSLEASHTACSHSPARVLLGSRQVA